MKKLSVFLVSFVLCFMFFSMVYAEGYDVSIGFMTDNGFVGSKSNMRTNGNYLYAKNYDGSLSVYRSDFSVVTDGEYLYSDSVFQDGVLRVLLTGNDGVLRYGGIDESGNLVIDTAYTELGEFEGGKALGILFGQTVMINTRGEIMHTYGGVHGYFGRFINGRAFVRDEPLAGGKCVLNADEVSVLDFNPDYNSTPVDNAQNIYENSLRYRDGFYIINEEGYKVIDGLTAETETSSTQVGGTWEFPRRYYGDVKIKPSHFNNNGIAVIKRDNRYALANVWGEMLTDFMFESYYYDTDNLRILLTGSVSDSNGCRTYCFDISGNILYKNQYNCSSFTVYDEVFGVYGMTAVAELNGRYGVVDGLGNVIIPVTYDSISYLSGHPDYFIFCYNGKYGMRKINSDVECVPAAYDSISGEYSNKEVFYVMSNGKKGVVSIDGDIIIDPVYEDITNWNKGFYNVTKDGKKGIADENGKVLIEPIYDIIYTMNGNSGLFYPKKDGILSIYDVNTDTLVELGISADMCKLFGEKRIKGEGYDLFCVMSGDKCSVLNLCNPTEPVWYDDVAVLWDSDKNFFGGNEWFKVSSGNKYGIIDLYNRTVLPTEYDEISYYHDNSVLVSKDGKYGIFNYDLEPVVPLEYDYIGGSFGDDYIYSVKDGKCGAINKRDNSVLVPFVYDHTGDQPGFGNSTLIFNGEYAYGFIDGKVTRYDAKTGTFSEIDADTFQNRIDYVLLGDEAFYWDGTPRPDKVNMDDAPLNLNDRDDDIGVFATEKYTYDGGYKGERKKEYLDKDGVLIYYIYNGKTFDSSGNEISDGEMIAILHKGHPFYDESLYWVLDRPGFRVSIMRVMPRSTTE